MTSPDLRLHARAYMRKGWAVVPLWWPVGDICSCPQGPECTSPGKHPHSKHGTREPLKSGLDVDLYWHEFPLCNIGIATGRASGVVVLDVDPGKGGWDSMKQLWARYGPPGPTLCSVTGGGGRHILFRYPGDAMQNAVGYMPGIDIRADGGLIVAPPSLHGSGKLYRWHKDGHPRNKIPAPMPKWMEVFSKAADRRRRDNNASRTKSSKYGRILDIDLIPVIDDGGRNNALCSIAGRLIWENRQEDEVRSIIYRINETKCKPPLPDREVERLVGHAVRQWAGR